MKTTHHPHCPITISGGLRPPDGSLKQTRRKTWDVRRGGELCCGFLLLNFWILCINWDIHTDCVLSHNSGLVINNPLMPPSNTMYRMYIYLLCMKCEMYIMSNFVSNNINIMSFDQISRSSWWHEVSWLLLTKVLSASYSSPYTSFLLIQ